MKRQETRGFQSEVKKLLNLMIHSLYSNKEIFLRELISNASDAADKLRFRALSQPDLYGGDSELWVRISYDKEKRIITFSDNGIGMNREEVIDNLGTIAKSGTKIFLDSTGSNQKKDNQFIGQFGVGFYSAFIVADKVTVQTLAANANPDKGVFWESTGEGDYTVADIFKRNRGTDITLHLREEEDEFLDDLRLKNLIKKYSDHIALSIEIENRDKEDKKLIIWEKINKSLAFWVRNKADISDEEYKKFYKSLFYDFNDPVRWSHNHVEGNQEYTSLLYIPAKASWDTLNYNQKKGLKLYVRRVFIMDDAEQFMPHYLRFVKGLIDSNDLPLNISREILQDSRITKNLKVALTKRTLLMLEKFAKDNPEGYQLFWQEFGVVLKEGIGEDPVNSETIAKLLRFSSTYVDSPVQSVMLESYVKRMIDRQEKIYYITADSYIVAKNSPHLALLRKKGIEVLLLSDRIDEWMMNHLVEFHSKKFQLISKPDSSLDELVNGEYPCQEEMTKTLEPFINRVKKYLDDRVKEVRLTYRLMIDVPAVVTTDTNDMTTQMAKFFVVAGQTAPKIKYIFELNPKHTLIKRVANITENDTFNKWIDLLLDQALLAEIGTLEDPNRFIGILNQLLIG